MISTNQFKNGNHIDVEGTVFKILEFQHVKPGKGGAFVRTKLRRAADGAVIDRTFRAGEKFRPVRTEARKMQFLYADGTDAHFMDSESFEQIEIPEDSVRETLQWIRPNETVDLLYIDDQPGDIQLAASVELEVTHTEPGMRGDTASGGGTKPATLETGATVSVPAVRQHRRPGQGRHAVRQLHVPCVGAISGGPRSSPSTSTTSRAARSTTSSSATPRPSRARSRTRPPTTPTSSTPASSATRRAGRSTASRRSRRPSSAPRCSRCCTPTSWKRDHPIPAEGAIDEAVETAKAFCGPDAPGFVNGILGAALDAVRENGAEHD